MKDQLSKYGLMREKDDGGFGQKILTVEFLKAQSFKPIQYKIFIVNSSSKSPRMAMKITGLFKVTNAQEGWISLPEKIDYISWISFKVESAVLKKDYYSKNRCLKLWEENDKIQCTWLYNVKVNILAFYMYVRSEAVTMGIKLHEGQRWQTNELLNI